LCGRESANGRIDCLDAELMPDPWNLNKLIENVPATIKAH
jgi:hypothetical protein